MLYLRNSAINNFILHVRISITFCSDFFTRVCSDGVWVRCLLGVGCRKRFFVDEPGFHRLFLSCSILELVAVSEIFPTRGGFASRWSASSKWSGMSQWLATLRVHGDRRLWSWVQDALHLHQQRREWFVHEPVLITKQINFLITRSQTWIKLRTNTDLT